MTPAAAWDRLTSQPVAVLATINEDGSPHLVPFTFASVGERRLVSAVDQKPKHSRALRRLENIARDDRVTVLAHHYEDDWSRLWWVRASGHAVVAAEVDEAAHRSLVTRFPPYSDQVLGPWITITVVDIVGWAARG